MRYELKLSAASLDVLPLALIADAVARASATAGGTPFHRSAYRGKLGKIVAWVVDEARNGRMTITDQDGRPGSFDELIQRAEDDGTYSEVSRGLASAEVDMNITHALCIYTTLKSLNEWARERGDEFSISRVGWIDERGWIEPNDAATENPPTADTILTSGRGKDRTKPVYSGTGSMSVVVSIHGREAIPVRAIPFVTGWDVSPDMVAKSLANSTDGFRLYRLTAYQYHANGSHTPILPKEWDGIEDRLRGLSESLKTKNNNRDIARPQWLTESVPILPAGVFVWRDELQTSWHRFSAQAGTRKGERPNDGMLNFSPLINPPETRAIVMEGFEGLPLAATAPPIVGEEPERARHDEEYDSAWDELESSSYHEQMGLAVLASLYPRGKRAVNISDERCLELARSTCLQVADWIELTGVRLGKHEHYFVEQSSVSFVKWSDEAITDAPTGWQPAMLRDNKTLPLPFPCTPEQLLQFVDTLHVGVHAFRVPDAFRQAVSESVPTTNTAPQIPGDAQQQTDAPPSGATEKAALEETQDDDAGQGDVATTITPEKTETPAERRAKHDMTTERGCRLAILENWETIEKLYGPMPNCPQIWRIVVRNLKDDENKPSLKTVRNVRDILRKAGFIP